MNANPLLTIVVILSLSLAILTAIIGDMAPPLKIGKIEIPMPVVLTLVALLAALLAAFV